MNDDLPRAALDDLLGQRDPVLLQGVGKTGRDAAGAVSAALAPALFERRFETDFGLPLEDGEAVLLCTLARVVGIPARLALARIRNHRVPLALQARLGTDEFPCHGYAQLRLHDAWVSVAPTFDAALCARVGVPRVDFDGRTEALLPARALDGGPYIEYLEQHGTYADLPLDFIVAHTAKIWGRDKRAWLRPEDDTGFP